jgi:hypothetical protein
MIKEERIDDIVKKLIKIIIEIEKKEEKEMRKNKDSTVVDIIFREFEKLVDENED